MKVKILEYILFIKYVNKNMTYDDCYLLKIQCNNQAKSFFKK